MISFEEFLLIEGILWDVGNIESGFSRKSDWNEFHKEHKDTELVQADIGSMRYKMYRHFSTYYLTTDSDEYMGYISFENNRIKNAKSEITKGFYTIMFTVLIHNKQMLEICSDTEMSSSAISGWLNLHNSQNRLNISVRTREGDIKATKENYLLDINNYLVCVVNSYSSEKIQEHMLSDDSTYELKHLYNTNSPLLDWRLFGEMYSMTNNDTLCPQQVNSLEADGFGEENLIKNFGNIPSELIKRKIDKYYRNNILTRT